MNVSLAFFHRLEKRAAEGHPIKVCERTKRNKALLQSNWSKFCLPAGNFVKI
jgi:hypothetical protein